MELAFTHGQIILEDSVLEDGAVLVKKGVIAWIGPTANLPNTPSETVDLGGFYLSPGFIDLHVHGGGGVDSSSADQAGLKTICKTHEATGTTSLCLALISSPLNQMQQALSNIHKLAAAGTGGARVLGSYLEGPFLNPTRVSAQEERWIQEPDLECLKALAVAAGGWMRVVTLAPELPGVDPLIEWLTKEMGLVAAIGHTGATCAQTQKAIAGGCSLATHLFNGMKPFHHRDPNSAGAVLASDQVVGELILDGIHVDPVAAKLAYRALGPDRFCLVTDATSVVGSESGRGEHGGRPIRYEEGAARFDDGQLAGSALTMIDAVKNMIDTMGVTYDQAVRAASLVPAKVLGIHDRLGSIAKGKHADLLVLDKSDLRVLYSYVAGQRIYRSPF